MDLNREQMKAVCHDKGPLIVFAGAGSGKTRIIVARIIYLIQHLKVAPWNILAVTFTNKAAEEMKTRVSDAITEKIASKVTIKTFHSLCLKILRNEAEYVNYSKNFSIIGESEKVRHLNEIMKKLSIENPPAKFWSEKISKMKNLLLNPYDIMTKNPMNIMIHNISKIYSLYEEEKKQNQVMDLDDLIGKTIELFIENPHIREKYQSLYKYIMIDEYQDTNPSQFKLISLVAERYQNIMVVGDDDQSIYQWRGADISKILKFSDDYPGAQKIILTQNYRSTRTILEAAMSLMGQNKVRQKKQLWTSNPQGDKITVQYTATDRAEAELVAKDILALRKNGYNYNQIAVFYRVNAQSRLIEEELARSNIPFRIVGNISFFSRKEIRDLSAYIRTILNPADSTSCKRIINSPKRGIGSQTVKYVEDYASQKNIGFFCALKKIHKMKLMTSSKLEKIKIFIDLIDFLAKRSKEISLDEFIPEMLEQIGVKNYYKNQKTRDSINSLEIIYEFENMAVEYYERFHGDLNMFSDYLALFNDCPTGADDNNVSKDHSVVSLMTLHNAKGLEFPVVIIVGMEEGLCPYFRNGDVSKTNLEEERRLVYVGMTRAKEKLMFYSAQQRQLYGISTRGIISRFLREIPQKYLNYVPKNDMKLDNKYSVFENREKKQLETIASTKPFSVGQRVKHNYWGTGTILSITGKVGNERIRISFDKFGIKKLKLNMAMLTSVYH